MKVIIDGHGKRPIEINEWSDKQLGFVIRERLKQCDAKTGYSWDAEVTLKIQPELDEEESTGV